MTIPIMLTFYFGTAMYAGAALATTMYTREEEQRFLAIAKWLAAAGGTLLFACFVLRWVHWGHLPMTTMTDSLIIFVSLTTALSLLIARGDMRTILCFFVPPLTLICAINAAVAHNYLEHAPKELRGGLLALHVGLAFFAYSLFFLASTTSAAYLFQAHNLKRHHTRGLFRKLPSLERLDRTLYELIRYAYFSFAATLLLGLVWAGIDTELLDAYWWTSPKVLRAAVMVVLYGFAFHGRQFGWLRGRKLSYVVFIGFSILLALYMLSGVMRLSDYHFWEATS